MNNSTTRNFLPLRALAVLAIVVSLAGCGATPVTVAESDDRERDSVLPRQATDPATHSERLIASGIKPLRGQNIVYTLDRLEAGMRRAFAGSQAMIIREETRLVVRCPIGQVIDPETGRLRPEFESRLGELAKVMLQFPAVFLEIGAHTDAAGDQRQNYRDTEFSANLIADYLHADDLPASHLFPVAFGESQLLLEQGSAAEKAVNNRVDFLFWPVIEAN